MPNEEPKWIKLQRSPRRQLDSSGPSVIWSPTGREGVTFIMQGCAAHDCLCTEVELALVRVDERTLEISRGAGGLYTKSIPGSVGSEGGTLTMRVDYSSGEASGDGAEALPWLLEELDGELLDHLAAAHWGSIKGVVHDEPSEPSRPFEPGELAPYIEVFPLSRVDAFRSEGERYEVFDLHCIEPSCGCNGFALEVRRDVEGERSEELGIAHVTAHAPRGRHRDGTIRIAATEPIRRGDAKVIESVAGAYLARHPSSARLWQRRSRLRQALHAMRKKTRNESEPAVAKVKVGRNAPCPCGSGKKYKKCCLAKQ